MAWCLQMVGLPPCQTSTWIQFYPETQFKSLQSQSSEVQRMRSLKNLLRKQFHSSGAILHPCRTPLPVWMSWVWLACRMLYMVNAKLLTGWPRGHLATSQDGKQDLPVQIVECFVDVKVQLNTAAASVEIYLWGSLVGGVWFWTKDLCTVPCHATDWKTGLGSSLANFSCTPSVIKHGSLENSSRNLTVSSWELHWTKWGIFQQTMELIFKGWYISFISQSSPIRNPCETL